MLSKPELIIYFVVISCTMVSGGSTSLPIHPPVKLPYFHGLSSISTCSTDSPEIYISLVALPSLNSTLEEAKVFFGVLMDKVHSSLEDSDELTDKVLETWANLTDNLLEGFNGNSRRITQLWNMLRDHYESVTLPWETRLRPTVIHELFSGLGHEYLVMDSVVKSGVREIMNSLHGYMGKLVRRLEVKMLGEDVDQSQANATELMQRMEETIAEEEPTLIGQILVHMFRRAKGLAAGTWRQPNPSFLERNLEETAILIQAFKVKSGEYTDNFWRQITSIMLTSSSVKSGPHIQQLYSIYSSNQEHLLNTLLALLNN